MASSTTINNKGGNLPPPPDNVTRYTLTPESELRIEIPIINCTITLKNGSAELL